MSDRSIPYTCPDCEFEADDTHCDRCDGTIHDSSRGPKCTGCGMVISWINCRKCGARVRNF